MNRSLRRISVMTRRYRRRRWFVGGSWALAVIIVSVSVIAYAKSDCYCTLAPDHGKDEPVHAEALPNACLVLNTPDAWQTPDGEQRNRRAEHRSGEYRDIFDNYELRQAPTGALLYIALRSRGAIGYGGLPVTTGTRYSNNHFAFELSSTGSGADERIGLHYIRRASDEEWNSAYPLAFSDLGGPSAVSADRSPPDFPALARVSNAARWAVRMRQWGGPKDEPFYYEFWYNPATYGSAAISASGSPNVEVRVWACSNLAAFLRGAAVHGEAYFTLPMNEAERKVLLCRTGAKPVPTVPAEASLAGTTQTGSFDN